MSINIQGAVKATSSAFVSIGAPDGDLYVHKNYAKAYRPERGLNVHRRRMYEEEYHTENVPVPRVKAC